MASLREGSLDAPTRHPIPWRSASFWNKDDLHRELERVYDICHGCRRCVSLCGSFPALFDLVDESPTMEVDGVAKADYYKVVDQCYLCDLCYMTKCPYVPPHEWNVDFPHLMLRAKAVRFREEGASLRDRVLTSTDAVNRAATIPLIDITVNALNRVGGFRTMLEKAFGVHREAPLPRYHRRTLRRKFGRKQHGREWMGRKRTGREQAGVSQTGGVSREDAAPARAEPAPLNGTTGKAALYATCYGDCNAPEVGEDLIKVFRHNGIQIELAPKERCCGMPKLELGDLDSVNALKEANIPALAALVDEGWDLTAPIPSCVLMYKQELPLLYPDDEEVRKVQAAFYDPFEYLWLRHRAGGLKTEFPNALGEVAWQAACHLRVQNAGLKTRDVLSLVPGTKVHTLERCSGHDGTYAVKRETRAQSIKIARPVARQVEQLAPRHFASDCPMAAAHIAHLVAEKTGAGTTGRAAHPMSLLAMAYGLRTVDADHSGGDAAQ